MEIFYLIIFFIFGIIFGSFFNVVGFRLPKNESLIKPSSHCQNCNHKLGLSELIPVFSYIFLKGKCKKCKQKISVFYPIIELSSGILFAVSYYSFGFSYDLIIALLLVSYFLIVIVSDLNFYIIPDQVTLFLGIVIIITNVLKYGFVPSLTYILSGLGMFIFMYFLMLLGNFLFKEESMGGGDIKMLFVLGMIMPIMLSFISLVLATLLALLPSLYLLIKKKDKIIPFGPFLVAGFLLIFFSKISIDEIYNFFLLV